MDPFAINAFKSLTIKRIWKEIQKDVLFLEKCKSRDENLEKNLKSKANSTTTMMKLPVFVLQSKWDFPGVFFIWMTKKYDCAQTVRTPFESVLLIV